ncbi:hypothetical protein J3R83DRAFT_12585 [Lanmaoa asiatica]|nr:hypothetical protein J3R83DRAFT_12585 [Lanmaoa asiatica]
MRSKNDNPKAPDSAKTNILWERKWSYCTDHFIEWCTDNPTKHVKLFSDSTQDACQEGRPRTQLTSAKKELFAELAKYIFVEKEQVLSLEEWGTQKAQAYVMATQRRHQILKNKYTECLKSLGETGAGLMVKDLQGSQYKNMLGTYFEGP